MLFPDVHIPGVPFNHHHAHDTSTLVHHKHEELMLVSSMSQYDWIWGLVSCVMGSIFIALGLVLQKFSHHENVKKHTGFPFYVQRMWVIGFLLYVVGQCGNLIAMAFAPQTMLSCLGTVSLIFNTIFAWGILGEAIVMAEFVAMGGLVAGVVIVILIVPDEAQRSLHHTAAGMTGMLIEAKFLILAGSMVAFLLAVYVAMRVSKVKGLRPIFYSLTTATLNGFNFTLWKCLSMLVINLHHPFMHWQLFAVLGVVTPLVILQPITLNMALRSGEAMIVVPTNFAGGIIAQIFCAEVAFGELGFIDSHKEKTIFWLAVCLLCTSIAIMVRAQISNGKESMPDEDPPTQAPKGKPAKEAGDEEDGDPEVTVPKPISPPEGEDAAPGAAACDATPLFRKSTDGSSTCWESYTEPALNETEASGSETPQPISHVASSQEGFDGEISGLVLAGPIVTMTGPIVAITPAQQRALTATAS